MQSARRRARSRYANATARLKNSPDNPGVLSEVEDRRRDYYAEALAEYIQKTVDAMPPLTDEQRSRLAALLRPASGNAP